QYAKFSSYLKTLTWENKMKEIGDIDACIRDLEAKMSEQKPTLGEYTHLSMLYIFKGEYRKAEDILLTCKLQ
ncbi:MAG: hypothetical protein ACRCUT_02350, partial [Spirochaetota bacterium]